MSDADLWEERPRRRRPEAPRPIRPEPQPVRVEFTEVEREWIRFHGQSRTLNARRAKARTNLRGDPISPAQRMKRDQDALGGEAGVAKACNVWWYPTPWEKGAADIEGFIEVRWTERQVLPRLTVFPNDVETRIFVLITGNEDTMGGYFIRGWMYGHEAQRDEWWGRLHPDRPPAWNVPVDCLRDWRTLPDVHRFRLRVSVEQ